MDEEKFDALCRKIESIINADFAFHWNPDYLSEVRAVFFPNYDATGYRAVYHDGYHVSRRVESLILDSTTTIGEEEVSFDDLRPEINLCTEEQLRKLESDYNMHIGDNILAYYPVNGFYALIRSEDYDPDEFDCGAMPY